MAKVRKMLGDIHWQDCISLMRLIETQSKATLAEWAITYAESRYLSIYEKEYPEDLRLQKGIAACREYLNGSKKLKEVKPALQKMKLAAQEAVGSPVGQAAARAISTACAVIQTPTNSLGFLFYGGAAAAYSQAGTLEEPEVLDSIAAEEFRQALESLKKVSVAEEENPVKVNWNC